MKILHISDPLGRHAELTNLPEDEDRNYFLIEIPCRVGFDKNNGPTNGPLNGPLTEKELSVLFEISILVDLVISTVLS